MDRRRFLKVVSWLIPAASGVAALEWKGYGPTEQPTKWELLENYEALLACFRLSGSEIRERLSCVGAFETASGIEYVVFPRVERVEEFPSAGRLKITFGTYSVQKRAVLIHSQAVNENNQRVGTGTSMAVDVLPGDTLTVTLTLAYNSANE